MSSTRSLQVFGPIQPTYLGIKKLQFIKFLHPGYEEKNVIITMSACDALDGGIHYETARIACCILTGCLDFTQGFFTETRDGPPVNVDQDDLLFGTSYFFYKAQGESRFGLVPSFDEWIFPQSLPASWESNVPLETLDVTEVVDERISSVVQTVRERDGSCRITKNIEATETAHLVPQNNGIWFGKNNMIDYMPTSAQAITSSANAILLRRDIHWLFDQKRFAIVPKKGVWTVHVLNKAGTSVETVRQLHNAQLHPLKEVHPAFLLARFAWALLGNNLTFQTGASQRILLQRSITERGRYDENIVDAVVLLKQPPGKSASGSPKKRPRSGEPDADCYDDDSYQDDSNATSFEDDDCSDDDSRGRSMKRRRWSSHSESPEDDGFDLDKHVRQVITDVRRRGAIDTA